MHLENLLYRVPFLIESILEFCQLRDAFAFALTNKRLFSFVYYWLRRCEKQYRRSEHCFLPFSRKKVIPHAFRSYTEKHISELAYISAYDTHFENWLRAEQTLNLIERRSFEVADKASSFAFYALRNIKRRLTFIERAKEGQLSVFVDTNQMHCDYDLLNERYNYHFTPGIQLRILVAPIGPNHYVRVRYLQNGFQSRFWEANAHWHENKDNVEIWWASISHTLVGSSRGSRPHMDWLEFEVYVGIEEMEHRVFDDNSGDYFTIIRRESNVHKGSRRSHFYFQDKKL